MKKTNRTLTGGSNSESIWWEQDWYL